MGQMNWDFNDWFATCGAGIKVDRQVRPGHHYVVVLA